MVPRAGAVRSPNPNPTYDEPLAEPSAEALDFVRFCYVRRGLGWPELYDEMCAVASRGLFRGWGPEELAEHGIAFGLFDMPSLSALAARIVDEDRETRLAAPVIAVAAALARASVL